MQDIPHEQLSLIKVINDPSQAGAAGNNGYVVLYNYRNEVHRVLFVSHKEESSGKVLHQVGTVRRVVQRLLLLERVTNQR